jgi:hypothetical protein
MFFRLTGDQREMPQAPPGLQAAALAFSEIEPPPATFEANLEIFLRTCGLPQAGQVTPSVALALRTSSSNG